MKETIEYSPSDKYLVLSATLFHDNMSSFLSFFALSGFKDFSMTGVMAEAALRFLLFFSPLVASFARATGC